MLAAAALHALSTAAPPRPRPAALQILIRANLGSTQTNKRSRHFPAEIELIIILCFPPACSDPEAATVNCPLNRGVNEISQKFPQHLEKAPSKHYIGTFSEYCEIYCKILLTPLPLNCVHWSPTLLGAEHSVMRLGVTMKWFLLQCLYLVWPQQLQTQGEVYLLKVVPQID